jgi:hypothetical protein
MALSGHGSYLLRNHPSTGIVILAMAARKKPNFLQPFQA